MAKKVGIAVVILLLAFLGFAATRPNQFRVQRSASIKAPPEQIFEQINDFHRWPAWSPWEKLDSAMKKTHGGAQSGKGAVYAWEGNNKVGKGRMEIVDASAPTNVKIKLDFLDPFEAHNTAEFTLEPRGDATEVTWAMYGPSPFMAKVMGIFFDMDRMVGKDFETGLANLKAITER